MANYNDLDVELQISVPNELEGIVKHSLLQCPVVPTVCTVASSVSSLAVSENSLPTAPDQDICGPPKKKRLSTESLVSAQNGKCSAEFTKYHSQGDNSSNGQTVTMMEQVKSAESLFGEQAHTDRCEQDWCGMKPVECSKQVQKGQLCDNEKTSGVSLSLEFEAHCLNGPNQKLSPSIPQVSVPMGCQILTSSHFPTPGGCDVISELEEKQCEDSGPEIRDRLKETYLADDSVGIPCDCSYDVRSKRLVPFSTLKRHSCNCNSSHCSKNILHTNGFSRTNSGSGNLSEMLQLSVNCSPVGSEVKLVGDIPSSANVSRAEDQCDCSVLFRQNLQPLFSTDCNTNAFIMHKMPQALLSSTDYETDTSACSEGSSSDAVASCDNGLEQSAQSASHMGTERLESSQPAGSSIRRTRTIRQVKNKFSHCSLNTDSFLDLQKAEHLKVKNQWNSLHFADGDIGKIAGVKVVDEKDKLLVADIKKCASINDLPWVLLVHILSYLSLGTLIGQVSLVCKKWQSAVLDPSLWRCLDLRHLPRLTDALLLKMASRSDRISTLNLSDGQATLLTDDGVTRALHQCPHLKKVKLNRCFFLCDEAFVTLGQFCHKLVYLNLSGCFTVTDKTLLSIAEGCPTLQDLDVSQCAKITDVGVGAIGRGCPSLTRFCLNQCGKLTNAAVQELADGCLDMQNLYLLSCTLSDEGVSHLSKLKKLRVLDISNVSQLSPRVVENVTAHCPDLETLAISLNRAVDDQCLKHIVTHCPRLKCLSCVACSLSDIGMHYIAQHARCLERLDVAWCADITDKGVIEISEACPRLRYLGIMRCGLITMTTIEQLLQLHPSIQYSNFELDSRRLLGRAAEEGFQADPT